MAGCTSRRCSKPERRHRRAAALCGLALVTGVICPSASAESAQSRVTEVRFWSLGEVTRVAIEVSSEFKYRHDRLSDPDRLFFDIEGARPEMAEKKMHVIQVGDPLLRQIRIAETQPGVTRIVLDLEPHDPPVQYTASQLSHPERLMIELRLRDKPAPPSTRSTSGAETVSETPGRPPTADLLSAAPERTLAQASPAVQYNTAPPAVPVQNSRPPVQNSQPLVQNSRPRKFQPPPAAPSGKSPAASTSALKPGILAPATLAILASPARPDALSPTLPPASFDIAPPPAVNPASPRKSEPRLLGREPLPAKHTASGEESMTRVLGLKLGRIVIDPGHGGHDDGTHGPTGLLEKDVVLDVAHRLGELLEERMGTDVIFTREDDTYIPLEERTKIANDQKADLFLSIHANSSPYRYVAGVETYYLNFTTSRSAMDVAARENASSNLSIFDLKDVLQKIAMKDKIDESREFAAKIQASLWSVSARNNAAAKNRGVKKAPFVVLIGASMPSVLAEIGFLTNTRDEALLRNPEHRQKIAEALYRGIAAYAGSLSHFQVARTTDPR